MKATRILSRSTARTTPRRLRPTSQTPILRTLTRTLLPAATSTTNTLSLVTPSHRAAAFSTSQHRYKGLQPDSAEPTPPNTEAHAGSGGGAAQISDSEYHEIADQYLDGLVFAAEELSEKSSDGLDVEYSAGVLTISHPQKGSYVINKQPPNKQIWLSSPVSGPKRYDWVVSGTGQHEKEGSTVDAGDDGAGGKWVYLRDGSTLSELLKTEVGVEVSKEGDSDVTAGREGPGGGGGKLE